ncbi:tho2 protein [Ascosphaera apis ARSEF 7405]|uniref:THO complex subunit 2 n=1 Tax=Ascosphaera apis ARSEF 7405 TaxID=392613 RepID=A0A168AM51_9EURO|nr:tho2 protein [Ascosphaera apis ARSEF 7405]
MAHPGGGGKRKRGDRSYTGDNFNNSDEGFRSSPYRGGQAGGNFQQHQHQHQQGANNSRDHQPDGGRGVNSNNNNSNNTGGRGGGGGRRGNRSRHGPSRKFNDQNAAHGQNQQNQQGQQGQQSQQQQMHHHNNNHHHQQQQSQQSQQQQQQTPRAQHSSSTPHAQQRRETTELPSRPTPAQSVMSSETDSNTMAAGATPTNDMPPPSATPAAAPSAAPSTPSVATATATPTATTASEHPQKKPAPPLGLDPFYVYEYVTDQRVASWGEGRRQVLEIARKAGDEDDDLTLSSIFQEIIQSVLCGRLGAADGGVLVKNIVGEDPSQDIDNPANFKRSSLFLDTLSIIEAEHEVTNPTLRQFIASTEISPNLMRQQLDTLLLKNLGMIRDTFNRITVRKQTNLLYRQSNYNLLREESEGYSKLLTELFTTSNVGPPSSEVVEDTFERVKAMIGAFNMDAGRALDITLDVLAAVLVKQYRFFVKFLRISSWWPRTRSIPGKSITEPGLPRWALPESTGWLLTEEDKRIIQETNEIRDKKFWDRAREIGLPAFFEIGRDPIDPDHPLPASDVADADDEETRSWIEQTGVMPPRGNRVAAQLLGFKLRFYSSDKRDPNDVLPDNLIYLAALLIKIGFISLKDLYPHLWRPDDKMNELKEIKMKEKIAREKAMKPGAGAMNALAMSGALGDEPELGGHMPQETQVSTPSNVPAAAEEEAAQEEKKEPEEQKVMLLKSLLAIGAIPESLYILGKFPWLLDVYPELPEFINRIIHHCLSRVWASIERPAFLDQAKQPKKLATAETAPSLKGTIRFEDPPPRRVLRWAQLDRDDENDATYYRYYWDDWSDNVPVCQTIDDVFTLCSTFLNIAGVKIGLDPRLLTKLARIGKESLRTDPSESNRTRWKDLCKQTLVPALSLTKQNPAVVNDVFDLLSCFPRDVRYNIYSEWHTGQTSRLPDIKTAFDQAKAETKDALKRLSKTNIRLMARVLAKIAYANPGIVVQVAISQIESYENLIDVVVEGTRYFTYMGYDILTWSLISALGQKGRSRMQEGGLFTSRWLSSLSSFVGRFYRRYYSIIDPAPLLQYVGEQLRQNNSTDLIVLEQLITSMAGIVTDLNFNDAQVQAMAGGEVLRSQTMLQLLDKRHESKTTSKRLIKSLVDSSLAGQLLILIAQERLTCIYKAAEEAAAELKLLGNIFDEIHRILSQYIDLLHSNLSIEEFDRLVPNAAELIAKYGLTHEVAFWIVRPSLYHRIRAYDEACRAQKLEDAKPKQSAEPTPSADEDVEMIDEGEMRETEEEKETPQQVKEETPSTIMPPTYDDTPWHPVLVELMDQMRETIPKSAWEVVGLPFFTSFWQLSSYDLFIPQQQYEEEIARQKQKIKAISSSRTDSAQKKENMKRACNDLNDRILSEMKCHLDAYGDVRNRLSREKDHWFAEMRGKHNALNIAILEQCLVPRLLLSPTDAFYCFKMLKYLHSSGTACFRTMGLIDQLFNDQRLTALIFQCTSKEADNLGRFLNDVLRDLGRWHADKAVYMKEAYGSKKDLPGFAKTVGPDGKPTTFLDYEDFRRLLYKWHRLFCAALKTCLTSTEYMHIRNAISVLKSVVQNFPAVNWMGTEMRNLVNNLKATDSRDDVKVPAASLVGDFNRRESQWMLPQMFQLSDAVPGDKKGLKTGQTTPAESKAPTSDTTEHAEIPPTSGGEPMQDVKMEQAEEGEIEASTPPSMEGLHPERSNLYAQASINAATAASAGRQDTPSEAAQSKPEDFHAQSTRTSRSGTPKTPNTAPDSIPAPSAGLPARPDLPRHPSDPEGGRGRRDHMDRHDHGRQGRPGDHGRRGRMSDRPQDGRRFGDQSRQEPIDQTGRLNPRDARSGRDMNRPPRGRGRGEMMQAEYQDQRGTPGSAEPHQQRLGNTQDEEMGPPRDRMMPLEESQRRHEDTRSPRGDQRQRGARQEDQADLSHLPERPERPDRDGRRNQLQRHDGPPTGPRANFPEKRGGDNRQIDPNATYGRLNQDSRFPNRQGEGFDRSQEVPSGPRRSGQMRPPQGGARNQSPHPASMQHDLAPPTGPAPRQNRNMPQGDLGNQAVPAPTPEAPNTPGMHPDRLKHFNANVPSGPRSSAPSTRPRPNERGARGGDRRMQQLQSHLQSSSQGSNDQSSEGTSIRGRGANRQPNMDMPETPTEKRSELFPDDAPPTRPGPGSDRRDETPRQFRGGRRGDLIDETSDQRRPPRGSTSRTHSSERGDRASEQGRERKDKDRDREREGSHRRHDDDNFRPPSTRKDEHRERHRNFDRERDRPRGRDHDRERERDRDRTRDGAPDTPTAGGPGGAAGAGAGGNNGGAGQGGQGRGGGNDGMRRNNDPSSGVNREVISSSGRGRRDNFERNKDRGNAGPGSNTGAGPMNDPNAPAPPPGGERPPRDGRESHRPRDRERGDRERDHPRERERDGDRERPRDRDRGDRNRDRDRDMEGGGGHPPPNNASGNWPRKRNRPSGAMEGGPDGPGQRFGHDNKRPRRTH